MKQTSTVMSSKPKEKTGVPTDTGWAWVVMFAVMLSTFLEMGLYKSFGIFFVEYIEKFGSSATVTSVVSSIFLSVYSFGALIVIAYGLEKISCRQSVMIGGVLLCSGYLLNSLATSIEIVFLAQGFLTAIGSAFVHGPSLVILSKYFDKRRGLSNSVIFAFGSLGGLVLPILFHTFVEFYDLEGALMITAGLVLNVTLAGSLLRPTTFYDKREGSLQLRASMIRTDPSIKQNNRNSVVSCDSLLPEESKKPIQKDTETNVNGISTKENQENKFVQIKRVNHRKVDVNEYLGSSWSLIHIPVPHSESCHQKDPVENESELSCGIFSKIFKCSLLRNTMFLLILIGGGLAQIECALAHIFIPPYAKDQGVPSSEVAMIAGTIGISEFAGRMIVAFVSDSKCVTRHKLISGALIITGVATQFTHFYDSVWTFVIFAVLYGSFSSVLLALYSPVCVDFLGLQRFRDAFGICSFVQNILLGAAVPLLGFFRDITGSYTLTFHVMGSSAIIGGIVILLLPVAKRYEDAKSSKLNIDQHLSSLT